MNHSFAVSDPCQDGYVCDISPLVAASVASQSIEDPAWYRAIQTFTYRIDTSGSITASLDEFSRQVHETLNDSRGWIILGLRFDETTGPADFIVVLANADSVPSFSPAGCSSYYSCTVANYVIVNQTRWLEATDPWNAAGGNLRDYRHMVVNHELGHWLGHPHTSCPASGNPAPLMMQQSTALNGCTFNPWPLESELWSSRL